MSSLEGIVDDHQAPVRRKHPAAIALGRLGGSVKSEKKSAASAARMRARWAARRASGETVGPVRPVAECVPTEYRGELLRLTKEDLAELVWYLMRAEVCGERVADAEVADEIQSRARVVLSNARSITTRLRQA